MMKRKHGPYVISDAAAKRRFWGKARIWNISDKGRLLTCSTSKRQKESLDTTVS